MKQKRKCLYVYRVTTNDNACLFYLRKSYEFDRGYVFCEGLMPIGRMSYMNFNPLVEVIDVVLFFFGDKYIPILYYYN